MRAVVVEAMVGDSLAITALAIETGKLARFPAERPRERRFRITGRAMTMLLFSTE